MIIGLKHASELHDTAPEYSLFLIKARYTATKDGNAPRSIPRDLGSWSTEAVVNRVSQTLWM